MRRFRNHQKRMRGRPNGDDAKIVMGIIEASEQPVSTKCLLEQLAETTKEEDPEEVSWLNRCRVIRKMLRAKEEKGEVQCLGVASDGSYLWVRKTVPIMQCAALVANEFLKRRQAEVCLDPERFEEWAEATQEPTGEI